MSWINNQVSLGEPLLLAPQPRSVNLTPYIDGVSRRGLGVVPGMDSAPQIPPLAIGGFLIGGGLIVGGVFVKGPGGVVMSIVGGISAGFSLITTLMSLMGSSKPSTPTSMAPMPPSRPAPVQQASRTQQLQQYAAALAPGAVDILSKLIPGLKPGTAPATPAPAPAPTGQIITSL